MLMNADATGDLRRWSLNIETALGITLSATENGAFALRTKGHAMLSVEVAPHHHALILTGQIGTADDSISHRSLKALLALNMSPGLSGTSCIGMAPENNALLMRLIWIPPETAWNEVAFTAVLTAFAEHVDALSMSLINGEINSILDVSRNLPPEAHSPQFA
ncbi:type III secretion system chaperone [Robbsia andropogonis]|uniref:type III secretion system chaperone n=1 Tax=Robbsia andropogonis TaxID=28092 RepID=UPI0004645D8A|nr:type III secretion system chaperone [Robbsia andropogonis]MCP1118073.1 type III secretion system chaperone [Robbsia andropogonis]MCP1127646.1 type III secretion system chaperone [Robbsia andropogonis]